MTGFGSSQVKYEEKKITIEMKTVNGRFVDVTFRASDDLQFLEPRVVERIKKRVQRGTINIQLRSNQRQLDNTGAVQLNEETLRSYLTSLGLFCVNEGITVGIDSVFVNALSLPGVFSQGSTPLDQQQLAEIVLQGVDDALDQVDECKFREGSFLTADMLSRLDQCRELMRTIHARLPLQSDAARIRLQSKLAELSSNNMFDQRRFEEEMIYFLDKMDISEELVRLESHIRQVEQLLQQEEAIGRKLEFFFQEMNREMNTIGSKSSDPEITYAVVELKTLGEQLREQVRNIE